MPGHRRAAKRRRAWRELAATPNSQIPTSQAPVVVMLERVANADNVGGVFRSAAAFGASAVLLDPASTDPLYRKAIRTSMGASLQVLVRARGSLARRAARPACSRICRDCDDAGAGRAAGARCRGRRRRTASRRNRARPRGRWADAPTRWRRVSSTHGFRSRSGVDSLNVATAAAIALYEFRREFRRT